MNFNKKTHQVWNFSISEVLEFAKLTGDNNPMHLDGVYAKNRGFNNITVHASLQFAKLTAFLGSGGLTKMCTCVELAGQFRLPLYPAYDYKVEICGIQKSIELKLVSVSCLVKQEDGKICSNLSALIMDKH